MNQGTSSSSHILSGWKDIANYLGKGVRTVQRYEGDLQLPVRRPAGRARGSVVATKEEIDSWVTDSPIRGELTPGSSKHISPEPPLQAMRQGIKEMTQLRIQMRGLRVDLHESLALLGESLRSLRAGIRPNELAFQEPQLVVGAGPSSIRALSLLTEELAQRKAS